MPILSIHGLREEKDSPTATHDYCHGGWMQPSKHDECGLFVSSLSSVGITSNFTCGGMSVQFDLIHNKILKTLEN